MRGYSRSAAWCHMRHSVFYSIISSTRGERASTSSRGGVEKASQHKCRGEPDERYWREYGGRCWPAEGLDPKSEHGRTGKLTEASHHFSKAALALS